MTDYISREAAIAYIREQSEECQKAFEELGGESGIYADAYNDLADNFYSIPAADVAPVVRGSGSGKPMVESVQPLTAQAAPKPMTNRLATMTDAKREIAEMPAADVVPVVHGKWIIETGDDEFDVKCPKCGWDDICLLYTSPSPRDR